MKIRDFIDAIEKNGLPKIKGEYYDDITNNKLLGGCALGQAARNLNIDPDNLNSRYYDWASRWFPDGVPFEADPVALNDQTDNTLPEIAAILRNRLEYALDEDI